MENPEILKWRNWSATRKGFVFGALAGFMGTAGFYGVFGLSCLGSDDSLLGGIHYWLAMLQLLLVFPADVLATVFGWEGIVKLPPWAWVTVMILVNGFLFAVIGTAIGSLVGCCKRLLARRRTV